MDGNSQLPRPTWKAILAFWLLGATLYTAGMLLFGRTLLLSLVSGVLWASLFVPLFLWISRWLNRKIWARYDWGKGQQNVYHLVAALEAAPAQTAGN